MWDHVEKTYYESEVFVPYILLLIKVLKTIISLENFQVPTFHRYVSP